MSSETRATEAQGVTGSRVTIAAAGSLSLRFKAFTIQAPGRAFCLISDRWEIDASLERRAELFGAEGYCVIAIGCGLSAEQLPDVLAHLRSRPQTEGEIVAVGHAAGALKLIEAAPHAAIQGHHRIRRHGT